jgi:uncharacterized membrane protein (DUF2068 family)
VKKIMVQRPVGISIIAVLAALVGIVAFVFAVFFAALSTAGSFLQDMIETYAEQYGGTVIPDIGGFITAIALAIAGVLAIAGILYLVTAYGLWTGRGWARILAIILLILDVIAGLVTLPGGIVLIIIAGVLLWYFFTPAVRAFFGAGSAPSAPPPPPQ